MPYFNSVPFSGFKQQGPCTGILFLWSHPLGEQDEGKGRQMPVHYGCADLRQAVAAAGQNSNGNIWSWTSSFEVDLTIKIVNLKVQ